MLRAAMIVGGLILVGFGCGKPPEPTAGGKPAEHWLEASENADPKARVEAIKKLGNMGNKVPEALSKVIEALADPSPLVRKEAIYAVMRNRPSHAKAESLLDDMKDNDPDPDIRKIASEAYKNITEGN